MTVIINRTSLTLKPRTCHPFYLLCKPTLFANFDRSLSQKIDASLYIRFTDPSFRKLCCRTWRGSLKIGFSFQVLCQCPMWQHEISVMIFIKQIVLCIHLLPSSPDVIRERRYLGLDLEAGWLLQSYPDDQSFIITMLQMTRYPCYCYLLFLASLRIC